MADEMECDYANNLGGFMHDFTAPVLNLGPDISACENGVTALDAGPGFASYRWQDGSTEQTLTAFAPGTYSVTVTDACGGTQTDAVQITTDPATVLDLGPDLEICAGGSQTLHATGFTTYQWTPADYLSCTDCPNPIITPTANITYTVVATNAAGCISVDTVSVSVLPRIESVADVVLCEGDTVMVFGMPVTSTGEFSQIYTASTGCDSIVTISVGLIEIVESVADVVLCEGDTVMVFGMPVTSTGEFSQTYTAATGCDSIVTISVGLIEIVESVADVVLCEGDTVMVFGMPVTSTGEFSQIYTASTGCDSIVTISVGMIPKEYTQESRRICQGSTTNIFGTPTSAAGAYSMTFASSATGCDSIHTIVLTVDAINLGITPINVSCSTLGSATVNVGAGNGPFTYQWSNSGTAASISNLAAGSYTVTVTDVNGCTNTASTAIQGALGPGASISVLAQLTEDEPDNGKLTASATGGTAPFSFAWSNSETTATIDSLSSGAYTVTVTDANGCTASATAYLYVPACTGGKIWNDMDRDGCQDAPTPGSSETGIGQVTLFLSGTTIWGQPVADTTVSAINGEYIFEGLAPGNYIVKIKLPPNWSLSPTKACNDDTHDSDFNTTTLLSGVVNLVEGHCCLTVDGGLFDACLNLATTGQICCDQALCGPGNDPAPITSLVPAGGGGGATQYLWMYSTVGGPMGSNWTTIAGANGPGYDPGPLSQTMHFVRCAKSATCTTWLESNFVTITVSNVAVADIMPTGSICINDPVTFTAAANGTGAVYSWNFGPWATPSTSSQPTVSVVFSQAGVTNVGLTVSRNDCVSTESMSITVSNSPTYCGMGITQPGNGGQSAIAPSVQVAGQFSAYPNPFSDVLTVAWDAGIESVVSVKLYSVEGRLLHSGQSGDGDSQYLAELGSLLPGVYLLHLQSENGEAAVFRVVKEK
ncbi:MAG: T9SS type A sorting domain-containing protein [Saprospiraceae bacterium]|nr:T9SS type A sorting domain-containing protein [Saprospiraceae bacterium]